MSISPQIVEWILSVVGCVLVADLLSGLLHWLEDAYGREHWPVTGLLVTQPNIRHHHNPRHFTRHSWFESSWLLMVIASTCVAAAWAAGRLDWRVWLVALIGANANQIHKWAHRNPSENGRLISVLQTTGLLQSPAHHARHHQEKKNTHYCVVTNLLNPVLDRTHFWSSLEWLVYSATGVRRRHDESIRSATPPGQGPIPPCRHCWHRSRGLTRRLNEPVSATLLIKGEFDAT